MSELDNVVVRRARERDLDRIVELLADDELGVGRETLDNMAPYRRAFAAIDAASHQLLVVADRDGEVIGSLQLSLLSGLSRRGASRTVIESVRVARGERGLGLGTFLMEWAIGQAQRWGCQVVQLASDKSRTDAHRFYKRLGFEPTHEGFKLLLAEAPHLDR